MNPSFSIISEFNLFNFFGIFFTSLLEYSRLLTRVSNREPFLNVINKQIRIEVVEIHCYTSYRRKNITKQERKIVTRRNMNSTSIQINVYAILKRASDARHVN